MIESAGRAAAGAAVTVSVMQRQYCPCFAPLTVRAAFGDIAAETKELLGARHAAEILDELSDICFGIGRLAAATVGRRYLPVPGAGRHIAKIDARMRTHGCIRSVRHLRDGMCPSRPSAQA